MPTDISLVKEMPADLEMERLILGSILLEGKVDASLDPMDFYHEANRIILGAIQDLQAESKVPDMITVLNRLRSTDRLDPVGGAVYLAQLTDGMPHFREPLAKQYVAALKEKTALRLLIHGGNEIMMRAYSGEPVKEILATSQKAFDEIAARSTVEAGLRPIGELMGAAYKQIEAIAERGRPDALPTGLTEVDRLLAGGLIAGSHTIVAGRPGTGKTSFLLKIAMEGAKAGIGVGIFSLEMGATPLLLRLIAGEAEVSSHKIKTGYLNKLDWERITQAAGRVSDLPIFIDDTAGITVRDIRARLARMRGAVKLLMVDYLQLLAPEKYDARASEQERISHISQALTTLGKSENLYLVSNAQLSRQSELRKDRKPQLSDLRSSGQIEQDASVVLMLYREELYAPSMNNGNVAEVLITKNRDGPTGSVVVNFHKDYTMFRDAAPRGEFSDE